MVWSTDWPSTTHTATSYPNDRSRSVGIRSITRPTDCSSFRAGRRTTTSLLARRGGGDRAADDSAGAGDERPPVPPVDSPTQSVVVPSPVIGRFLSCTSRARAAETVPVSPESSPRGSRTASDTAIALLALVWMTRERRDAEERYASCRQSRTPLCASVPALVQRNI